MIFNYQDITESVLSELSPRTQEIISRRFGLGGVEKETLQSIGKDHGITRERVRQIEKAGLTKMKERTEEFGSVFNFFQNQLEVAGGLRRENIYLGVLGPSFFKNYILLLLTLDQGVRKRKDDEVFHTLWALDKAELKVLKDLIDLIIRKLEKKSSPLDTHELVKMIDVETNILFGVLEVAKPVKMGPQGLWGLSHWSEISPRGTKDKAKIVLREKGKPMHFTEIAEEINQGSLFTSTEVHPQTVHNELIKEDDFVLVGRGIYALRKWGYRPGTVKEVIIRLLKEKGPMTADKIVDEVLKRRVVKKNTVLLNLRRGENFVRTEGRYKLKEK